MTWRELLRLWRMLLVAYSRTCEGPVLGGCFVFAPLLPARRFSTRTPQLAGRSAILVRAARGRAKVPVSLK